MKLKFVHELEYIDRRNGCNEEKKSIFTGNNTFASSNIRGGGLAVPILH